MRLKKLVRLLIFLARFDFKKAEKKECSIVSNLASQQVLNHGVLQMHEDKGMYQISSIKQILSNQSTQANIFLS